LHLNSKDLPCRIESTRSFELLSTSEILYNQQQITDLTIVVKISIYHKRFLLSSVNHFSFEKIVRYEKYDTGSKTMTPRQT
jgi:hypothetical protein